MKKSINLFGKRSERSSIKPAPMMKDADTAVVVAENASQLSAAKGDRRVAICGL